MSEAQRFPNYINGEWVESDRTLENRNPADTSELVGVFSKASAADATRAAEAAAAAFPAWAAMNAPAHGALLFKIADSLEKNLDQLASEMTREEGKTLPEAKGETMRSINIFRYFAGEGSRQPGMMVPSERPRVFMWAERKPVGVVSLINPWNFPSAIPAWKLAPALIAGNTVLLKPASAAPLCSWRLVEACHKAGVPAGVVNYLCGSGGDVGNVMVDHPAVNAVSFTGSCEVGNAVHRPRVGSSNPDSARDGRQEPDDRSRGRRPGQSGREYDQRFNVFDRPKMHGHQPRDRRRRDL